MSVSRAKTAEPIEMLFEMRTRGCPRSNVLDGGPDPPQTKEATLGLNAILKVTADDRGYL